MQWSYHQRIFQILSDEPWYCRACNNHIFPFNSLDNSKFSDFLDLTHKRTSLPPPPPHPTPISDTSPNPSRSICNKKVKINRTNISCSNCLHLIHKKCSKLKQNEIAKTDLSNWECVSCLHLKFPFTNISPEELNWLSFNFNSNCLCSPNNNTNNDSDNPPDDPCNNIDIKPNFKFYDTHDFHKLKLSQQSESDNFTLFHTNICSLQSNIEDLEILLHGLNHDFDVISLTETWNPELKKHLFSAKHLDSYHAYIGSTGSTNKSGAGLYIHKQHNPIPRPDFGFKYYEKEDEEFEMFGLKLFLKITQTSLFPPYIDIHHKLMSNFQHL